VRSITEGRKEVFIVSSVVVQLLGRGGSSAPKLARALHTCPFPRTFVKQPTFTTNRSFSKEKKSHVKSYIREKKQQTVHYSIQTTFEL
jgi:hypothetical protein